MTTEQDNIGGMSLQLFEPGVEEWLEKRFPLLSEKIFSEKLLEEFQKENPKMSREKSIRTLETTPDVPVLMELVEQTRQQLNLLFALSTNSVHEEFDTARGALVLIISKSANFLPSPLRAEALDRALGNLLMLAADPATSRYLADPLLWLLSHGGDLSAATLNRLITCLSMVLSHSQVDRIALSEGVKESLELAFKRRALPGMDSVLLSLIELANLCGGSELPVLLDVIAEHSSNPDISKAAKSRAIQQRGSLASVWKSVVVDQVSSEQFRADEIRTALSIDGERQLILCIFTQCKGYPIKDESDPRFDAMLPLLDHESPSVRLSAIHCFLNECSVKPAQEKARLLLMKSLKNAADDETKENAGWVLLSSISAK